MKHFFILLLILPLSLGVLTFFTVLGILNIINPPEKTKDKIYYEYTIINTYEEDFITGRLYLHTDTIPIDTILKIE
jgi:hypothetical protein